MSLRRRSWLGLGGAWLGLPLQALSQAARPATLAQRLQALTSEAPELLLRLKVPGMAVALVTEGQVSASCNFGLCEAGTQRKVQADTVFEAASMSKPVFAYVLMQAVQAGLLELDRPVMQHYLPQEVFQPAQAWQGKITARMLLTHTAGLPNWRSAEDEQSHSLHLLSEPGQHFNYSGEGYFYLQRVLEQVCGRGLQDLAEAQLFKPLGMQHSSFVLTPAIERVRARGHDEEGQVLPSQGYTEANAAYTLYTTAADYARFLVEMIKLDRSAPYSLKGPALHAMLSPSVPATDREPIARPGLARGRSVSWALGWAINSTGQGDIAYHTGTNRTGFRCYSQVSPSRGSGFVLMSNGLNGHLLWRQLMEVLGDL